MRVCRAGRCFSGEDVVGESARGSGEEMLSSNESEWFSMATDLLMIVRCWIAAVFPARYGFQGRCIAVGLEIDQVASQQRAQSLLDRRNEFQNVKRMKISGFSINMLPSQSAFRDARQNGMLLGVEVGCLLLVCLNS